MSHQQHVSSTIIRTVSSCSVSCTPHVVINTLHIYGAVIHSVSAKRLFSEPVVFFIRAKKNKWAGTKENRNKKNLSLPGKYPEAVLDCLKQWLHESLCCSLCGSAPWIYDWTLINKLNITINKFQTD